jgi:hypothetical protein
MSMRVLAAAGVLAASQWAGSFTSIAADLYQPPYDPPRAEAPDDDPRYGDVYRIPPPPYRRPRYAEPPEAAPYPPPRYAERSDGPPYPRGGYAGREEYLPPMRGPRFRDRYTDRGGECVPRHEIRRSLREDGWGEIQGLELRGEVAIVRASRPSGAVFELTVDRCSGHVLRAEAVGAPPPGPPGPYAWGRRERYTPY